mmetsp:Transcript_23507/g.42396  ORF Transcript_23507/g.42396 Transcript_23507/m.42396 type:complete len:207 (+) Transcript_23507:97-717(+)
MATSRSSARRRHYRCIGLLPLLTLACMHCFLQAACSTRSSRLRSMLKASQQESLLEEKKEATKELDAWQVLGLREGSDKKRIRRRFRKLVATEHPDRKPNDPNAVENFLKIRKAYEKLMGTRSAYGDLKKWAEENREWSAKAREFLGEEEDEEPPEVPILLAVGFAIVAVIVGSAVFYGVTEFKVQQVPELSGPVSPSELSGPLNP